jgi:hypothetical protein
MTCDREAEGAIYMTTKHKCDPPVRKTQERRLKGLSRSAYHTEDQTYVPDGPDGIQWLKVRDLKKARDNAAAHCFNCTSKGVDEIFGGACNR